MYSKFYALAAFLFIPAVVFGSECKRGHIAISNVSERVKVAHCSAVKRRPNCAQSYVENGVNIYPCMWKERSSNDTVFPV